MVKAEGCTNKQVAARRHGPRGSACARLSARWSAHARRAFAFALVWCAGAAQVRAQATGAVRVACDPPGCSYVLDGRNRMSDREVTLMEGPHRFVFWAPERRMLDTTYMVLAGATRELRVQLRYSPEFIAYRHEADRYRRNERWARYGPPVAVAGTAVWAGLSIKRVVEANDAVDALVQEYSASSYPAGLLDLRERRLPAALEERRDARTMAYVSSGVLVASAAAAIWIRRHVARKGAPVFEDKEKLRFESLSWMPARDGAGAWMAAFTLPLR